MKLEDRRDDWRNSVDSRLVNLTSAQKSADDNLTDIEKELADVQAEQVRLDRILTGDHEDNLDGLVWTIKMLQKDVARFNTIIDPDNTGHKGLLHDIEQLVNRRDRWAKREGYFWTFLTAAFVQLLILVGLLIVNWPNIQEYVLIKRHTRQAAQVEQETKKAKAERDAKRYREKKARAKKPPPAPVVEPAVAGDPEDTP